MHKDNSELLKRDIISALTESISFERMQADLSCLRSSRNTK